MRASNFTGEFNAVLKRQRREADGEKETERKREMDGREMNEGELGELWK